MAVHGREERQGNVAQTPDDSKVPDDPLAEFRGGEVQIGGISRKIAGQIHPAAFRQISQSATSDQMAGDPYHYQAYATGERGQEGLEIRRVLASWRIPSYRYLMEIIFNGHFATEIELVFSFLRVRIWGRNLQDLVVAIRERTCVFIQDYHEHEFSPPDTDAPVITRIEVVVRGEDEEMGKTRH